MAGGLNWFIFRVKDGAVRLCEWHSRRSWRKKELHRDQKENLKQKNNRNVNFWDRKLTNWCDHSVDQVTVPWWLGEKERGVEDMNGREDLCEMEEKIKMLSGMWKLWSEKASLSRGGVGLGVIVNKDQMTDLFEASWNWFYFLQVVTKTRNCTSPD